jgi:hypothetical protein
MKQLKNLFRNVFYVLPRAILFGIFLLAFFIIFLASMDHLNPYGIFPGIQRAKTIHSGGIISIGNHADKTK